jgi:DNA-binding transcriptional LysR family regulator
VPDFLVLGAIVERTDCVALVPRKLADYLCRSRALRIVELMHPRRQFAIEACWSLAATGKRGHAWVRDLLVRAARELG